MPKRRHSSAACSASVPIGVLTVRASRAVSGTSGRSSADRVQDLVDEGGVGEQAGRGVEPLAAPRVAEDAARLGDDEARRREVPDAAEDEDRDVELAGGHHRGIEGEALAPRDARWREALRDVVAPAVASRPRGGSRSPTPRRGSRPSCSTGGCSCLASTEPSGRYGADHAPCPAHGPPAPAEAGRGDQPDDDLSVDLVGDDRPPARASVARSCGCRRCRRRSSGAPEVPACLPTSSPTARRAGARPGPWRASPPRRRGRPGRPACRRPWSSSSARPSGSARSTRHRPRQRARGRRRGPRDDMPPSVAHTGSGRRSAAAV